MMIYSIREGKVEYGKDIIIAVFIGIHENRLVTLTEVIGNRNYLTILIFLGVTDLLQ